MTRTSPSSPEDVEIIGREVPEWIGATPDTKVPQRVKDRVFIRFGGRCHWSRTKIMPGMPWDVDHVRALCNGGENRESNLAPILRGKVHKAKTAEDVALKSKVARTRAKHLGIHPKSPSWNRKLKKKLNGQVEVR